MSDKSDQMRPIPDGGLKDAMPSWLKRPPAWRDLPSVEERHERTLPDPDTSLIDPHSLVDVNVLPQWLQSIAARGEPQVADIETPDEISVEVMDTPKPDLATAETTMAESPDSQVPAVVSTGPVVETAPSQQAMEPEAGSAPEGSATKSRMVPLAIAVVLALAIALYFIL